MVKVKSLKLKGLRYGLFVLLTIIWNVNAGIIFSEFEPNPLGPDPSSQTIEIFGTANTYYNNLSLLAIEADVSSDLGAINSITSNISGQFNNEGLATFDVVDLENPSFVLVLLQGDMPFQDDLDSDDDGYLETTDWFDNVLDAIGIYDSHEDFLSSRHYAEQLQGISLGYSGGEPQLVFRDLEDFSLYAVNDFGDNQVYDQLGNGVDNHKFNETLSTNSFGSLNPTQLTTVPEPPLMYMVLIIMLWFAVRNRKRFISMTMEESNEPSISDQSTRFSPRRLSTCK